MGINYTFKLKIGSLLYSTATEALRYSIHNIYHQLSLQKHGCISVMLEKHLCLFSVQIFKLKASMRKIKFHYFAFQDVSWFDFRINIARK